MLDSAQACQRVQLDALSVHHLVNLATFVVTLETFVNHYRHQQKPEQFFRHNQSFIRAYPTSLPICHHQGPVQESTSGSLLRMRPQFDITTFLRLLGHLFDQAELALARKAGLLLSVTLARHLDWNIVTVEQVVHLVRILYSCSHYPDEFTSAAVSDFFEELAGRLYTPAAVNHWLQLHAELLTLLQLTPSGSPRQSKANSSAGVSVADSSCLVRSSMPTTCSPFVLDEILLRIYGKLGARIALTHRNYSNVTRFPIFYCFMSFNKARC
ncbi:unnamed protein product [Protopolystoma xenopodis]|uniref:Uncharacterized protein n=1 Tax=Protopolystoma xenopodis TaxID=117903 RepID=A0A3S4ZUS9_9PLAT|nr:unnamed protein product [Protopolystoma xenopodis]